MLVFFGGTSAVTAAAGVQAGGTASIPPAETIRPGESTRRTVRAVRVAEALNLDGILNERVYQDVQPITDFVQQDPIEGVPATEATRAWVLFTDDTLYVAAALPTDRPADLVANEMRRDHPNIVNNDNFAVVLDTFLDRRNGILFHTNPVGGLYDALISDEGAFNRDWNTVWEARTAISERGWAVEIAIPFKSLRYRQSGSQVWGINFRRIDRVKNETAFLTPVARQWGNGGIAKLSLAAVLEGLEIGRGSRTFEIKPYAIGAVTTDRSVTPAREDDWSPDIGGDVKLGLTRGLMFDATFNTDFAQVEVDEQQVNLTRFSLFFPEKRDFFLEGQGIFNFGAGGPAEVPLVFFSRRIGLHDATAVPIIAGARVSGRAGPYSIGGLSIRQDGDDASGARAATFTVGRLKRDVGRRHTVGAILTHRTANETGASANVVAGADAAFWLADNVTAGGYFARSDNGNGTAGSSFRGQIDFNGDLFGASGDYLLVDPDFDPAVGYVRRSDIVRMNARFRYSPRPARLRAVRRFEYSAELRGITDTDWQVENRVAMLNFNVDFENGDGLRTRYSHEFEHLDEAFELADAALVAAGNYSTDELSVTYQAGPRRRLNGSFGLQYGTFYAGTRTELDTSLRFELTSRVSFEPRLNINWLDIPFDPFRFRTTLAGSRVNFTFSPRTALSALLQYNSTAATFASNVRFRWEFIPGSDLFVVYSDSRDTEPRTRLQGRSLVVKVARLIRF